MSALNHLKSLVEATCLPLIYQRKIKNIGQKPCDNCGDIYEPSDKLLKHVRGDHGVKEEMDSEFGDDDKSL